MEEVKKPGYEYTTRYNRESSVRNLVEQKTTQDAPVVTVLRKKGEATFLIYTDGYQLIRVFSPQCQTNYLDLLEKKGGKKVAGSSVDLQVVAYYGVTTGKWTVTYSATNGTDGLIVGPDLLYEAPSEGYQKEVVLTGPSWPQYLYLRSRSPAIYTRFDLEHSTWKASKTNEGFRISYEAWINPYGERNLEYDSDLKQEWRLVHRLEAEAKAAHGQGKRPEKPNLPKLLKEARANEGSTPTQ